MNVARGFVASARFERVARAENGNGLIIARYKLAPPGGAWDRADNGTYEIRLRDIEVIDNDGHGAPARLLGTFIVRIS